MAYVRKFGVPNAVKLFCASKGSTARVWLVGIVALGVLAVSATLHVTRQATAATTLTIQPNAPTALSAKAGIRFARFSDPDGQICFRASRRLPGPNRLISETFCTH